MLNAEYSLLISPVLYSYFPGNIIGVLLHNEIISYITGSLLCMKPELRAMAIKGFLFTHSST